MVYTGWVLDTKVTCCKIRDRVGIFPRRWFAARGAPIIIITDHFLFHLGLGMCALHLAEPHLPGVPPNHAGKKGAYYSTYTKPRPQHSNKLC
mmetsp:Transcript_7975/g.23778  ORF Transcript_7975/g.23778 Transcript_7975/m.23778 type:complete len:92 (+) Transcript_7975:2884-3159(+)